MLPQAAAAQIEAFVARGGTALAEARTAWNDETGYCGEAVPGFGLEKVFGCRERGAQGVDEGIPVPIRIVREHPALPLLHIGEVLIGARFREAMEPLSGDAEVVGEFEDGSPAIVVHRYGQGWALFAGTMLSFGFYEFKDENAGKLLKGLPQLAKIKLPVTVHGVPPDFDLELRLLEGTDASGGSFRLFFAFNHTDRPAQPQFAITALQGSYLVTDVITDQPISYQSRDGRLTLGKTLDPREIWVVKIVARAEGHEGYIGRYVRLNVYE